MKYGLITPARNERDYIDATIRSVAAQSVTPVRWVIVSDGSTDGTDEIIKRHASEVDWIVFHRLPELRDRSFAAKAGCFNAGFALLKGVDFELIGNLDADITLPQDYYERLVDKFVADPKLGVAGTPFVEDFDHPEVHSYAHRNADLSHVSGACQTFRRECFEEVGGYTPIPGGGIDWVAVTTARMRGWKTRTFTDRVCFHHRKMGTAGRGPLAARFRHGFEDYYLGGHPLWQVVRALFQMRNKPIVFGGLMLLCGYVWGAIKRVKRPISGELVSFHRHEQLARLKQLVGFGSPQ